jgi:DNA-binding transcriptional regulator LsrR (DeoR family)
MISVDTLYGIIEDGLNSKMGQVAIADKYGVGQTTVNRIFKLHDIRVKVKIKQVFTFRMIFNTLEGFKYALCENGVIVKQSKPFSDQKKALKSAKDMCYYYNKKANANSDLFVDNEGGVDG